MLKKENAELTLAQVRSAPRNLEPNLRSFQQFLFAVGILVPRSRRQCRASTNA
uniref:AlNc14C172G8039 protein n=1 Tax=Albugo laibachii Nc14 TaxID=890382 RepID=F0WNL6_9STRA|nr:AlNc14C172G8039 [Albugo laibachii Nc14]|eukprot:CCA22907.1 AlNc14C172G8039 [Albugo laibachii Nc14]